MFNPKEVLDIAIRIEKNGEAVYRNAIQQVSDTDLKEALQWMADEEAKHIEFFTLLTNTVQTTPDIMADELTGDMLKELIGDQSFSLKDVDFSQVPDVDTLIRIFIEFENDGIIFYEMIKPFVKNQDTLDQLQEIIDEEKRHIQKLESFAKAETAIP